MKRSGTPSKLTCAICGNPRLARQTWFSVTEDCELDRLSVWKWHLGFAHGSCAHNVCGQRHLRELIVHWMTTGCLHYPFAVDPRSRTRDTATSDRDNDPDGNSHQLAEITVDRESI